VRLFPSRSICASRWRWSVVDAASCVTWTTPRTSPWSAVCDGLRLGSWHFGSPLCEAMTVGFSKGRGASLAAIQTHQSHGAQWHR
jgi:hypothetical protein